MATPRSGFDEEDVRRKAFEIWEARGRPLDSAEEDWFEAIRLLDSPKVDSAPLGHLDAPPTKPAVRGGELPLGLRFLDDAERRRA